MSDRLGWNDLRERRMAEPGAAETYEATRIAFELGQEVRHLREGHGWTQSQLARAADDSVRGGSLRGRRNGADPASVGATSRALDRRLDVSFSPNMDVA